MGTAKFALGNNLGIPLSDEFQFAVGGVPYLGQVWSLAVVYVKVGDGGSVEEDVKTPYGKECKFYYSDYFRGRESEECRLIENNPESEKWFPALCQNCPVPDILLANQCEHLHLYGRITKSLFGLSKKVEVESFCDKYFTDVEDPRVGCGHCHELDLEDIEVAEN